VSRLLRGEEFEAPFHRFRRSVFRLETLQVYRGSGEDEAIAAFDAGLAAPPDDPVQTEWEAMIRGHVAAGRMMQRVHVVVEPPSAYMRFELTWAYAPNAAAGEDIRIIPVTGDEWSAGLPRRLDFWLFDSTDLYIAHYGADGTWLGVEPVDDDTYVRAARAWRDEALQLAQPWRDYIATRPELAARLPPPG
jgi:hypothetical protein